jgi:WbqC-like protein family
MSFRNRALIAGANGIISLSVPLLEGRSQRMPFKDVRISNAQPWQSQHIKSIRSAYNRSPWFNYYEESLVGLFEKKKEFLLDWNLACFDWVREKLNWPVTAGLSSDYREDYDSVSWIDRRNRLLPKNYQEEESPRYRQVFEERTGFYPNLSILDLLFCEGRRAAALLKE